MNDMFDQDTSREHPDDGGWPHWQNAMIRDEMESSQATAHRDLQFPYVSPSLPSRSKSGHGPSAEQLTASGMYAASTPLSNTGGKSPPRIDDSLFPSQTSSLQQVSTGTG